MADSVGGIIDFGGRTNSTCISNEIVPFFTDTFSINKHFIVVAFRSTESKVHNVTKIAFTFLGNFTVCRVNGTDVASSVIKFKVLRKADALFKTEVEDTLVITRNTANTETLIVNLIPLTFVASSVDWIVSVFAAALTVLEDLVLSTANHTVSKSTESVSFRAGTLFKDRVVGGVS